MVACHVRDAMALVGWAAVMEQQVGRQGRGGEDRVEKGGRAGGARWTCSPRSRRRGRGTGPRYLQPSCWRAIGRDRRSEGRKEFVRQQ